MKIGLQINKFTWPGGDTEIANTLRQVATTADQGGFTSIWVMDHFFQIHYIGQPEEPMLEAYTTLGYLAGITKKAMLGTMVTGVIYRQPALLVNAVTTLDVLSNGRAYYAVGAAWNEEESKALGFRFPPVKERFEHLEENLQIATQMFAGDETAYHGKHYHLDRPLNSPQVMQKPHPPIMIGGGGEKKTLRLVAQYADACNLFARLGEEELIRKLDILKEHCKDVGRDYDEIEKTVLNHAQPGFDPKEIIEQCKNLRELGFTHVIFSFPNVHEITPLQIFSEKVIPAVTSL